jgi:hypothetical protein
MGLTLRWLAGTQKPATRCEQARCIQADVSWWHPWPGNDTPSRVPRQALFTRIPEAPRYLTALAEADAAAARAGTPVWRVRPVAPYDRLEEAGSRGTGAASSSGSRVGGRV